LAQPLTLGEIGGLPARALANLALDRAGAWHSDADVHLRAWPWPYRAGLALSNDCDSQSVDCLRNWHSFVNGKGATTYGDGLGLEVGDSFWVYGNGVEPALWKGNPFDAANADGYALGAIVALAQAGFLDTLHSFGNWTARLMPADRVGDPTLFARESILRGLDRLDALGLKPSVYVNHSGSPSNVGGPWGSYQRADNPAERLYALDALRAFGLRFYWPDACTDIEKFGNELRFDSTAELKRSIEQFAWEPWLRRKDTDGIPIAIDLPDDQAEIEAMFAAWHNRAIFPVRGGDGTLIHAFKRYRGIDQPVGSIFSSQVTEAKLARLEAQGGAVVIYQHFGVFGPRGRAPTISRHHRARSPIPALDRNSVATWQLIAERHQSGALFVATQGRLLDWIWRRSSLRLSVERTPTRWVVTLAGFACPVEGERPVEDRDLNGLALVIPADAPEVVVVRLGRTGVLPMHRAADGANHVVHMPWQPLEWFDVF